MARAIVFEVMTRHGATVRFLKGPMVEAASGPGARFERFGGGAASLPRASALASRRLLLWVTHTGMRAGDRAYGRLVVQCDESGETWSVPVRANTVARREAHAPGRRQPCGWDSGLALGAILTPAWRWEADMKRGQTDSEL
jgi:hypothetical protein